MRYASAVLQRWKGPVGRTFGLFQSGKLELLSLEREWKDNRPYISSIPAGSYLCKASQSPRFLRRLYLVHDVPGRSGIRFHVANLPGELMGCIALGLEIGTLGEEWGLLRSGPAMEKFHKFFAYKPFRLEIRDA